MGAMKDSGVEWIGEIPQEWISEPLRVNASFSKGLAITKADLTQDGVKVISYGQVHSKLNTGTSTKEELFRYVPSKLAVGQSSRLFLGDLAFADTSEDRDGLGAAAYIDTGEKVYAGYDIIICRPDQSRLLGKYFAYLALTDAWRSQLRAYTTGVKVFHVTQALLKRTYALLPPLEEQVRITDYLDGECAKLDKASDAIEAQLSTFERYRASVIHEAVTRGRDPSAPTKPSNVDWIGDIPQGWEIKKLKHLVKSFESGTSVRAASYPAEEGEKGVLSLSAVFGGAYNPLANKRIDNDELARATCPVKSGSLLVSRCNTSEWVGLPAFVGQGDSNLYLPDKLWQIDCGSPLLNKFVWYAMHSKGSREYCAVMSVGSSSSMQNIASFDLLNMYIPLPKERSEIKAIVAHLDARTAAIDAVVATKRRQLDVLKRRRQSLIYEYVTGKRRVGEEG